MKVLECGLECAFRAYLVRDAQGHFWEVEALAGDLEEAGLEPRPVCMATRDEWEAEIASDDALDDGYLGGVPVDCPIYQGEVTPPWEESHAAT